jgi:2-polyprenyl-6-hydroxyphenyl methylase/3-demethylubiquinone-9 3-methyltransferase
MNPRLTTCLWFAGNAEEAANFYAATFPDSHVDAVRRAPTDYPAGKAGDVLTVEFTVLGQSFLGLNGGPGHNFTDAVSFQVFTDTQAETDRLWDTLTADGGEGIACSWCRDRFGVPWQVVPRQLTEGMADPDPAAAKRVMQAMMGMVKIDIAAIEAARRGDAA